MQEKSKELPELIRIKEFIGSHELEKLEKKSIVMFLGNTGSGKSTTIGVQLGAIYQRISRIPTNYALISSDCATPKTGDAPDSTTTHPKGYHDTSSGLVYVDMPGFIDTRGLEENIWIENNIHIALSVVEQLKSVVLVVKLSELTAGKGALVRDLAKSIYRVFGEHDIYDNINITITDVTIENKNDLIDSRAGFNKIISGLVRSEENKLKNLFAKLKNKYCGSHILFEKELDIEELNQEERDQISALESSIKLLKNVFSDSNKVIFADPNGQAACSAIQTKLLTMIERCRPIKREQLDIISRQTKPNVQQFVDVLTKITTDYSIHLDKQAKLWEKINNIVKENYLLLQSASRDPDEYIGRLLREKEQELEKLGKAKTKLEKERKDIRDAAEDDAEYNTYPVNASTKVVGGSFNLFKLRQIGKGLAQLNYEISTPTIVPISKIEVKESHPNLHWRITYDHRELGTLHFYFKAEYGRNLREEIVAYVKNKDLSSTKQRIDELARELGENSNEQEKLKATIRRIATLQTEQDVMDFITEDRKQAEDEIKLLHEFFQNKIKPESTISEENVKAGLESILHLMSKYQIIRQNAPQTSKDLIDNFLGKCSEIKKIKADRFVQELSKDIISSEVATTSVHIESIQPMPRRGLLPQFGRMIHNNELGNLISAELIQKHLFELGFAAVSVSAVLFYRYDSYATEIFALAALAVGTYMLALKCKDMLNIVYRKTDNVTADLLHQIRNTRLDSTESIAELVEYFKEHWKVDVGTPTVNVDVRNNRFI